MTLADNGSLPLLTMFWSDFEENSGFFSKFCSPGDRAWPGPGRKHDSVGRIWCVNSVNQAGKTQVVKHTHCAWCNLHTLYTHCGGYIPRTRNSLAAWYWDICLSSLAPTQVTYHSHKDHKQVTSSHNGVSCRTKHAGEYAHTHRGLWRMRTCSDYWGIRQLSSALTNYSKAGGEREAQAEEGRREGGRMWLTKSLQRKCHITANLPKLQCAPLSCNSHKDRQLQCTESYVETISIWYNKHCNTIFVDNLSYIWLSQPNWADFYPHTPIPGTTSF